MSIKYSSKRHKLVLSEIELEALNDMLCDIEEYVTDEMFTSPRGLGAFRRIKEKTESLYTRIKKGGT